jgi:mRNA-degrading endonuclease RelE of RelBE toxin-antitoxin system
VQTRIRRDLEKLAADAAAPGRIGGKRVRTIRGAADSFHRLRAGDYRVLYDVHSEDRVLHVLGIVDRGDLERWLRSR